MILGMRRLVWLTVLLPLLLAVPRATSAAPPDAWNDPRLLHAVADSSLWFGQPCTWSWSHELLPADECVKRLLTWPMEVLLSTEAAELSKLAGPDPVFVCDIHCFKQPGLLAQKIARHRKAHGQATTLVLEAISEDMQSEIDGLVPFDRNRDQLGNLLDGMEMLFSLEGYVDLIPLARRVLAGGPGRAKRGPGLARAGYSYFTQVGQVIDARLQKHGNLLLFFGSSHILTARDVRGFAYPPKTQIVVSGLPSWEVAIRRRLASPPSGPLRLSPTTVFFPVSDTASMARATKEWLATAPDEIRILPDKLTTSQAASLRSEDAETLLAGLRSLAPCAPWARGRYAAELTTAVRHADPRVPRAVLDAIAGEKYGRYGIPAQLAGVLVTALQVLPRHGRVRAAGLLARIDLFDASVVAALRDMSSRAASEGRLDDLLRLSIALAASLHCDDLDTPHYRRCLLLRGDKQDLAPLIRRIGNCGPLAASLLGDLQELAEKSTSPSVRQASRYAADQIARDLKLVAEWRSRK